MIKNVSDFIFALMYNYPKSSGIDEENQIKKDLFFKKYHSGLKDLKNVDFNKLYDLVLENSKSAEFAPDILAIKELIGKATKAEYVDAKLVSFCFRQGGQVREYAYPRREFEAYSSTIDKIKAESEKFWFGTIHEEPA